MNPQNSQALYLYIEFLFFISRALITYLSERTVLVKKRNYFKPKIELASRQVMRNRSVLYLEVNCQRLTFWVKCHLDRVLELKRLFYFM